MSCQEETIKLNREMLREAWNKVFREQQNRGYYSLESIERELFGPRKPREFTLYRNNAVYPWVELCGEEKVAGETIRVREVLDVE